MISARALVLFASTRPPIDVFSLQQEAAQALLRGTNPYLYNYRDVYRGQGFGYAPFYPYLPLPILLSTPFYLLGGDVRWLYLVAEVAAFFLVLTQLSKRLPSQPLEVRSRALFLLCCTPSLFVIDQAWLEPLVAALCIGLAIAVSHGRQHWSGLLLGGLTMTKQTAVLLLPPLLLFSNRGQPWRQLMPRSPDHCGNHSPACAWSLCRRGSCCGLGSYCAAPIHPTSYRRAEHQHAAESSPSVCKRPKFSAGWAGWAFRSTSGDEGLRVRERR